MNDSPSKENIAKILKKLIDGSIDRFEVSTWAQGIYMDDSLSRRDEAISLALERLSSVDLISTDRPYLYTSDDFKMWLKEFQ